MRIGFDRWVWVVINPTELSTLDDILFRADLNSLQNYLTGTALGSKERPSDRDMAIWTDEDEARADAQDRLERNES